jgi:hypothetical protein
MKLNKRIFELNKDECDTVIWCLDDLKTRLRITVSDCEKAVHPEMCNATEHFRKKLLSTETLLNRLMNERNL